MQNVAGQSVHFTTSPEKCGEHYFDTMWNEGYVAGHGYGSFCIYCGTEEDYDPTPEQLDAYMEQALDIMYPTPEPFERWT